MLKHLRSIICVSLAACALLCGCGKSGESQLETTAETVAQTTAAATAVTTKPATVDTPANVKRYDFLSIKQKTDEINETFNKYISERRFKGVVYMKLGNDFEYLSATGSSDSNNHKNNSINTRFYIGSLTEQFTAAAVLSLVDSGKLSLDDTIDEFFPDYEYGDSITVENLLNMTSGIPNYVVRSDISDMAADLHIAITDSVKDDNSFEENKEIILDWILSQELRFEPSTSFESSDSNYYLLGEIIASASGKSYEEYIRSEIFKPLAMNATSCGSDEKLALPYDGREEGEKLCYSGVGYSACGIISNISDLLKWTDGIFYDKILSDESINIMRTATDDGYSCGMYVSGDRLTASGRCGAYSSMLSYTTDKSEIFVSLSNYNYSDPSHLRGLFRKYLSKYSAK